MWQVPGVIARSAPRASCVPLTGEWFLYQICGPNLVKGSVHSKGPPGYGDFARKMVGRLEMGSKGRASGNFLRLSKKPWNVMLNQKLLVASSPCIHTYIHAIHTYIHTYIHTCNTYMQYITSANQQGRLDDIQWIKSLNVMFNRKLFACIQPINTYIQIYNPYIHNICKPTRKAR